MQNVADDAYFASIHIKMQQGETVDDYVNRANELVAQLYAAKFVYAINQVGKGIIKELL